MKNILTLGKYQQMFASFTFTDNNTRKSILDPQTMNNRVRFGQIAEVSFSPTPNINSDIDTNEWVTTIDTSILPEALITTIDELVAFLNIKTIGYTWASDFDTITVTHGTPFAISNNYLSRLILGCTDFTSVVASHTFNYVNLFPYSENIIYANTLLPAMEMSETEYYHKGYQINGSEFWNGSKIIFDTESLINRNDINISVSTFGRVSINIGVKMNDGIIKRTILRPTKPFSIKLYFTCEEGF